MEIKTGDLGFSTRKNFITVQAEKNYLKLSSCIISYKGLGGEAGDDL